MNGYLRAHLHLANSRKIASLHLLFLVQKPRELSTRHSMLNHSTYPSINTFLASPPTRIKEKKYKQAALIQQLASFHFARLILSNKKPRKCLLSQAPSLVAEEVTSLILSLLTSGTLSRTFPSLAQPYQSHDQSSPTKQRHLPTHAWTGRRPPRLTFSRLISQG